MPIALLGLGPVVSGLLALLLLVAGVLLLDLVGRLLDKVNVIPGIGVVTGGIGSAIHSTLQAMGGFLTAVARNVVGWIYAIPNAIDDIQSATWGAVSRIQRYLRAVIYDQIPAAFRAIASTANSIIRWTDALVARMYAQAIGYTNAVRALLYSAILSVAASLTRYITDVYRILSAAIAASQAAVVRYALGLYNNAIGIITNVFNSLVRRIELLRLELSAYALSLARWAVDTAVRTATDWARRYADYVMNALNQAINVATAIAIAPAWPRMLEAIDAISLALPESIAAVLARIGAFPRVRPRDLAGSIGAIAAVGAIAIDWVAECGLPLCRNVKGFGDELAQLQDDALIALIFGMVAEAMVNPRAAVDAIHDDIVTPVRDIGHEALGMIRAGA